MKNYHLELTREEVGHILLSLKFLEVDINLGGESKVISDNLIEEFKELFFEKDGRV